MPRHFNCNNFLGGVVVGFTMGWFILPIGGWRILLVTGGLFLLLRSSMSEYLEQKTARIEEERELLEGTREEGTSIPSSSGLPRKGGQNHSSGSPYKKKQNSSPTKGGGTGAGSASPAKGYYVDRLLEKLRAELRDTSFLRDARVIIAHPSRRSLFVDTYCWNFIHDDHRIQLGMWAR